MVAHPRPLRTEELSDGRVTVCDDAGGRSGARSLRVKRGSGCLTSRLCLRQAIQFWLNRGVDGFRVDAIHM